MLARVWGGCSTTVVAISLSYDNMADELRLASVTLYQILKYLVTHQLGFLPSFGTMQMQLLL